MKVEDEETLQSKQLSEYFKQRPEYKRLLKEIKNKYISIGEIKGNVIINNPDRLEEQALSGLMKKDYLKNKSIRINLKVLEQRIDSSKFSGAKLKDVIHEYFGEEITTNKESKVHYEAEIAEFFDDILGQNVNTQIYRYLEEIIKTKNVLYQNWKKYYNKNKEEFKKALLNACKGMNNLPEEKVRIPVFASNITGNPHGFDRNIVGGKILIMLLCYIKNVKVPQSSEELAEIYYSHNLLIDDVSNMVLCKNIEGFTKVAKTIKQGQKCTKYVQHDGLTGFAKYNEPIYLNLYNLSNIGFLNEYHKYNEVVVMENPAVFMEVSEKCRKKDFPLVCTYGQVKLSGLILLDMLVEQNYKIYYSGDIDPEGIQIADKLKIRYKENLCFLGFDVDTYKQNLSAVEVNVSRLKKLDKIASAQLHGVCNVLKLTRRVSFEEENINAIIDFIDKDRND